MSNQNGISAEEYYCDKILDFVNQTRKPVFWKLTGRFELMEEAKKDAKITSCPVVKILEIVVEHQYDVQFVPTIKASLQLELKDYLHFVYPNRKNLTLVVQSSELAEDPNTLLNSPRFGGLFQSRLDVLLSDTRDINAGNTAEKDAASNKIPDQDKRLIRIDVQLYSKRVLATREIEVGGIFNDTTNAKVFEFLKEMAMQRSGILTDFIYHTPEVNKEMKQLIVPQGTPFLALPKYFQEKEGGWYAQGGINVYNQVVPDLTMYLYPPFSFKGFNERRLSKKLTCVVMPKKLSPKSARTYVVPNNDELLFVTASEVEHRDDAIAKDLMNGNGLLHVNVRQLTEQGFTVNQRMNSQILKVDPTDAASITGSTSHSGVSYVRTDSSAQVKPIGSESDRFDRDKGRMVYVNWEACRPDLLYPWMQSKIIYHKKDVKYEMVGSLLKLKYMIQLQGSTMSSDRYVANATLGFFMQPAQVVR